MINLLEFQTEAIEKLTEVTTRLWKIDENQLPIVFKSPTGSGKTLMAAKFINGLNHLPYWKTDKAFIWITFSDDLAMQSMKKFSQYFGSAPENSLLTVDDLNQGFLMKNDVLFLNWQKVVSKSAENRIIRRPKDLRFRKESGCYFEDFIDGTHDCNREIILIIDEAHTNVTADLAQEIIDYINPKLVLHISATPKSEMVVKAAELNSNVFVDRNKVIEQGLIRSKIVTQTHEDLEGVQGKDLDHVLLQWGLDRHASLVRDYEKLGRKVNPLLLVQLPNDDANSKAIGEKSKEEIVRGYLESIDYDMSKVASWFDDHSKPDSIEDNESEFNILLFKLAAGTGWDCPRAQILVMYRNVRVEQRYIQTVGRILRMPEPEVAEIYFPHQSLCSGYLYTNYNRKDITPVGIDGGSAKLFTNISEIRLGMSNVSLPTAQLSRTDYGDLSNSAKFQESFIVSMNHYFGIKNDDILGVSQRILSKRGVLLDGSVKNQIVVDVAIADFDNLDLDYVRLGSEVSFEMSKSDVEKMFDFLCWRLLSEQTDEAAKISNVSRSWSPLKSSLRVWLKRVFGPNSDYYYRVFIQDVLTDAESKFRPAITQALKEYRPIRDMLLKKLAARKEVDSKIFFELEEMYSFPDTYEKYLTKLSVIVPFYIPPGNFPGRINELSFVDYLEKKRKVIEWWFKQGVGSEYLAIKYLNSATEKLSLFYPDWIIKFKDGRIGIFDTKSGNTATDTEGRAEALSSYLKEVGPSHVGGIVVKEGGVWFYNSSIEYSYVPGKLTKEWVPLESLFI